MLRFDDAIIFPPLLKSNLSVILNIKMRASDVSLFSEFINIVSIFITECNFTVLIIMLLYTFLVISFDSYKEWTICLISFTTFFFYQQSKI